MKFFKPFTKIKDSLTLVGNKEHLNFFSILLIIALDIFVIFNLFQGLDRQTSQITTPREKVPYQCTQIINEYRNLNSIENKSNFIDDLVTNRDSYYNNRQYGKMSYQYINTKKNNNIIPECKKIYDSVLSLRTNLELKSLVNQKENILSNINTQNSIINRLTNNYDTMLLEKIANQKDNESIIVGKAKSVKNEVNRAKTEILRLNTRLSSVNQKIVSDDSAKETLSVISRNTTVINEILDSEKFWYPLKKYGIRFLFLLPLFLIFWFLYRRASQKESSVSSLIFAHLLTVTTIPIILGIFEMLFSILPMHFFDDFFKLLEALNIAAVFNYILILIGILITMFLIYIAQKKLFSKQKTYLKRIDKQKCVYCNAKQGQNNTYCYKCGEEQFVKCISCNQKTHKEGLYCTNCGIKDFK